MLNNVAVKPGGHVPPWPHGGIPEHWITVRRCPSCGAVGDWYSQNSGLPCPGCGSYAEHEVWSGYWQGDAQRWLLGAKAPTKGREMVPRREETKAPNALNVALFALGLAGAALLFSVIAIGLVI